MLKSTTLLQTLRVRKYTNSKIDQNVVVSDRYKSLGRELGDYEKVLAMAHDRGNHVLTGAFEITAKEILREDEIIAALKLVQKQQPMLRMTIQKTKQLDITRYHFVEMENSYVNFAVPETNDYNLVLRQQVMERFDVAAGPMWRIRLVKQSYPTVPTDLEYTHPYVFIFAFHHCICDGISVAFPIGTFFYYLTELHAGKAIDVTPMKMLPPMDVYLESVLKELKNEPADANARYFQAFEGEKNAFIAKYSAEILRSPSVPIETRSLEAAMSQKETLTLLDACKKNGATVTGTLIAANCIVMADLLNAGQPFKDLTIPVELPVNIRPYITDSPGINNCLLCSLPLILYIHISKDNRDNFWNFAKICTLALRQAMEERRPLKTYLDIKEKLKKNPVLLRTGDAHGIRITPLLMKISNSTHTVMMDTDLISVNGFSVNNTNQMDGAVYYLVTQTDRNMFQLHMSYYPHISSKKQATDFFKDVISILHRNCEIHVRSNL